MVPICIIYNLSYLKNTDDFIFTLFCNVLALIVIVHPEIKSMSSFTHPANRLIVLIDLHSNCFPAMEVNGFHQPTFFKTSSLEFNRRK